MESRSIRGLFFSFFQLLLAGRAVVVVVAHIQQVPHFSRRRWLRYLLASVCECFKYMYSLDVFGVCDSAMRFLNDSWKLTSYESKNHKLSKGIIEYIVVVRLPWMIIT